MTTLERYTRHAGTDQSTGAAGTTVKWKGNSMFIFELWLVANEYWLELDLQLHEARHVSCDDRKLQARDDLALWLDDYEAGCGRWADGFNAVQNALDVLERGKAA